MNIKLGSVLMVLFILLTVMSWSKTIPVLLRDEDDIQAELAPLLEKAEAYEAQDIYYDASLLYEEALALSPENYEIEMRYADALAAIGESLQFQNACERAIRIDPARPDAYEKLLNNALGRADYTSGTEILERTLAAGIETEEIARCEDALKHAVSMRYAVYTDALGWHGSYASVCDGAGWGLLDRDGGVAVELMYDAVGGYDRETGFLPVCKEGIWYYRDLQGYKRRQPEGEFTWLGAFGEGLAPACDATGHCGYLNADMQPQGNFSYTAAGVFSGGVAAVQKDGKWALISDTLDLLTDFVYEDILQDAYTVCESSGRVFARTAQGYVMLDCTGARVGTDTYEDVKMFGTDGWAAVKLNGVWCAVDLDGAVQLKTAAAELDSFHYGLAAANDGSRWYFMDQTGRAWYTPPDTVVCEGLGALTSKKTFFQWKDGIAQLAMLYYLP